MTSGFIRGRDSQLTSNHIQRQNFAGLALGHDFEWPAADLAISREPLRRDARIDRKLERLAAEGAMDWLSFQHERSVLRGVRKSSE